MYKRRIFVFLLWKLPFVAKGRREDGGGGSPTKQSPPLTIKTSSSKLIFHYEYKRKHTLVLKWKVKDYSTLFHKILLINYTSKQQIYKPKRHKLIDTTESEDIQKLRQSSARRTCDVTPTPENADSEDPLVPITHHYMVYGGLEV